jgi:hypothetical protein
VAFVCDRCDRPVHAPVDAEAAGAVCRHCGEAYGLRDPAPGSPLLERCLRCGEGRLYTQKDFNRKLGLGVFVIAALLSVPTWGLSLLAATIIDFMLYHLIGDVSICYGCATQHRGFRRNPQHGPFDLHVAETVDRRPKVV